MFKTPVYLAQCETHGDYLPSTKQSKMPIYPKTLAPLVFNYISFPEGIYVPSSSSLQVPGPISLKCSCFCPTRTHRANHVRSNRELTCDYQAMTHLSQHGMLYVKEVSAEKRM